MFGKLRSFDVYRKLPSDLTEPTMSGAIVSVASAIIMIILFITEFNEFLKVQTVSEMFIDINRGGEKLKVNIDLVLPRFPCDIVSLDAQDIMGTHHVNVEGDLWKKRIAKDGVAVIETLKHEHVNENELNLDRVKKAYDDEEGCQLVGSIEVNKVPGNFHVSSHAYANILNSVFQMNNVNTIDVSHKINHISFGDDNDLKEIKSRNYGKGVLNPIDGIEKIKPTDLKNIGVMHQYYINVVPTTFEDINGKQLFVHQFTANSNEIQTYMLPALYFRYDLSPVTVKFTLRKESFFRFLVQICAIIGGIFTVAGIIDAVVHKSMVAILKKAQIGKLN